MEKEYNRKRHSKSNEFSGKQVYEDERILPFKSEIWLHLKTLICSNSKDTKTLEEILSCLRSIKSRDSEKGRIALDATYELFFAQYVLTTTNCDSNEGKENLTRILGVAVSRVVGHLQDMQASLENYRGASIQQTLQFFKIDIDIANYRNEFVHGTMPNLHILLDSIDKLTKLIIEVYWNFFDGDITWPKDVSDNDLKIISNIRKIIDLIQSPEVGLANYENFINENTVIQLRYSILKNCNLFIKLLMGTRNLIVIESVDIENNISENCNFTPKSYHIIVMNNILKLLSEDGDVFEFARYTGECAIEAEDDYFKKQYIYWTSWLIKKIVTGKLVCKWEIKELSKLCIILNLKECLEKIFEHYNIEVGDFVLSNQSENNKMDTDDDIKIVDISGPWGS